MKFLLSVLFSLFVLLTDGQEITVQGSITDNKNSPLPGAAIILMNPADSAVIVAAITNIDGHFTLTTTVSGERLLKISFIGFNDHFQKIILNQPAVSTENIVLIEKST